MRRSSSPGTAGEDRAGRKPQGCPCLIQLTTAHPRYDTRVFIKMCQSLYAYFPGTVHLVVADGEGEATRSGISIHDLGKPLGGRMGRAILGPFRALRAVRRLRADAVHFHDPELLPLGVLLRILGHRTIYDVHEDVPETTITRTWIPGAVRGLVARATDFLERWLAQGCTGVIVATPHIGRRFRRHHSVLVQNYPVRGELLTGEDIAYQDRPPNFAYVGGVTERRGVREMVAAICQLPRTADARLILAGPVRPSSLLGELGTGAARDRTDFLGWADRASVGSVLARSRAGLVLLQPGPNHPESQPNKLFEYMSVSLPVIASDFAHWREMVEAWGCCLFVDPTDPAAISAAMEWILDNPGEAAEMGRRGRRAVEEKFNWTPEEAKLVALYRQLVPALGLGRTGDSPCSPDGSE